MHPALSIIVFTTVSGLGYGLAAMLGLGLLDPALPAVRVAHVLALALVGAGLLASTLHLGNPQRAWRAFSQWRTSWLSREGVMAVATFVPLTIAAWLAVFEGRHAPAIGLAGAAMAAVTVYCTAMIYASLRAVDAWHNWLTPACYLLFALAGGLVLATAFAAAGGQAATPAALAAAVALIAAWAVKIAWRRRLKTLVPTSTPSGATGLGGLGTVRLFASPHGNDSYLTREMGFRIARKHADRLFAIAVAAGGVLPVLLLVAVALAGQGALAIACAGLAALLHVAGMLVERWLFFAEARHAVMAWYGR